MNCLRSAYEYDPEIHFPTPHQTSWRIEFSALEIRFPSTGAALHRIAAATALSAAKPQVITLLIRLRRPEICGWGSRMQKPRNSLRDFAGGSAVLPPRGCTAERIQRLIARKYESIPTQPSQAINTPDIAAGLRKNPVRKFIHSRISPR